MSIKNIVFLLTIITCSSKVFAGYDANITSKVTRVVTYAYTASILIRLENQPASHPECNEAYFAIDADVPADHRQQMLSRLLVAFASGEPVQIGYDKTGDCSGNYIKVHRVG